MTHDLPFRSATELTTALKAKEISSAELLEEYWARHQRLNTSINAIVVIDIDEARAGARAADGRLASGEKTGPLEGLPMTVKESFDWAGKPTTWGVPAYRDNRAKADAATVERLKSSGAVIFGKTNVPFMLSDWQSFNDIYGTTNNPWDTSRAPGGSSGGAAAALAAGLTGLELGSDIGASIRNPSHYCGVYGHKPSFGIVPERGQSLPGHEAPADISVSGPLARSAEDLELAMNVLAGPDGIAARGVTFDLPKPRHNKLEDFRVAVMLTSDQSEVDQPLQDLIANLADFLSPKVKTLSMTARPDFDTGEAFEVYINLLRMATSDAQSDEVFAENQAKVAGFAPDDDNYYARMLKAFTAPHRDWIAMNQRRYEMRLLWDRFFEDWDVLLCPAAASAAYPHDQKGQRHERTITVNGHEVPTTDQLFWAGYSCCFYLPGTVAPIGLTPAGLPVGVQIVTAERDDLTSIEFAKLIEQQYYSFQPPPGFE